MTNPDYRAMCAELIEAVLSDDSHIDCLQIARRARALLAEPEAVGPSDPISELVSQCRLLEPEMAECLTPQARWRLYGDEAQPVAEGPTDQEIEEWADACPEAPLEEMDPEVHGWRRCFTAEEFSETIRAALSRWGRPAAAPVPVSERLPEPSTKVLAHYFNALGKGRTICAIWVPAKSRSDEGDLDADDFLEYDEDGDKYYWPEGWYEAIENWEELGWVKVYEGEIAYWQPLPQWPAHALPTPEATND